MEICSHHSALLSNYEVLQLLEEMREKQREQDRLDPKNTKHAENFQTIQFEVIEYLKSDQSPVDSQNATQIQSLLEGLKDYPLTKIEKLQIINMRPTSIIELHLIEEPEDRDLMGKFPEICELVKLHLPRKDKNSVSGVNFDIETVQQQQNIDNNAISDINNVGFLHNIEFAGSSSSNNIINLLGNMHDFMEFCLRQYFKTTGWNENNQYSNLCAASRALLDFKTPFGFTFTLSKMPTPLFKSSYCMNALPTLSGSIGYLLTSRPLLVDPSARVPFEEVVDRFNIYYSPQNLSNNNDDQDNRVKIKDYLLFARMYIPTTRLEALYSKRFSPNLQCVVAGISDLKYRAASHLTAELHYDAEKWCTEFSFSTEGALFGIKGLYNFTGDNGKDELEDERKPTTIVESETPHFLDRAKTDSNDYDNENAEEEVDGLKGQWSVGAEVYYGARERSGGEGRIYLLVLIDILLFELTVSTGIRYRTLPQHLNQSPLTVTYLFNPIMGHMTAAFAAQVSDDLALCPRFYFNIYSYESDLTIGCEWWQREKIIDNNSVDIKHKDEHKDEGVSDSNLVFTKPKREVLGVVKATIGTSKGVSLLWEGRYGRSLFSMGVVADLTSHSSPIRSLSIKNTFSNRILTSRIATSNNNQGLSLRWQSWLKRSVFRL
ncbi:13590_t:CDS:10 [Ambispora leptoticha]|uniref:Mitochondrial distribution and morphology protein 10 n=1 Tax=Ambispora leptoticha TaxID=144679 RepID=A0A9N8VRU8_9GLOM|nr:13590_t:CDS:10 [Ambispora leptoticha]